LRRGSATSLQIRRRLFYSPKEWMCPFATLISALSHWEKFWRHRPKKECPARPFPFDPRLSGSADVGGFHHRLLYFWSGLRGAICSYPVCLLSSFMTFVPAGGILLPVLPRSAIFFPVACRAGGGAAVDFDCVLG